MRLSGAGATCCRRRCWCQRRKLRQCGGPVLEVDAHQSLGADVGDNITAVVKEQLDAVLLHEARLVLAIAAEEPPLLWQERVDARGP